MTAFEEDKPLWTFIAGLFVGSLIFALSVLAFGEDTDEDWEAAVTCMDVATTQDEVDYCAEQYPMPESEATDSDYVYPHNDRGWPFPCEEDEVYVGNHTMEGTPVCVHVDIYTGADGW